MDHPVIEVERVSKRYCRNLKRGLWYGVLDIGRELLGRGQAADRLRPQEFWALQDVSCQIRRGESMGLIGSNGAGKTTLLKLVNGLVRPNAGRITVNGSVRALIALGTGFNPVLTGRENVRVAAAILGYHQAQIEDRFEEILSFSELGEYIDAPVQSYSSGMLARLGFSIAVHTQPDILLVDEVLAVGDLAFAIKCYRKISEFRTAGGSILLVSHAPYAIRTNCDRAIWLEKGVLQSIGPAHDVCREYELFVSRQDKPTAKQWYLNEAVTYVDVGYPPLIQSGGPFSVEFTVKAARSLDAPMAILSLSNVSGQHVVANNSAADCFPLAIQRGLNSFRVVYDTLPLAPGVYHLNLVVAERHPNNQCAVLIHCHKFEVQGNSQDFGVGMFVLRPTWVRD